jgi:3-phosphoshikimate 1-carboxyvinyltransferase
MQRACAAALLHNGKTIIRHPGSSGDDKAAIQVIQDLGARIEEQHTQLHIESTGVNPPTNEINCRESGLGVRMFTPIAALSDKEIIINGMGSLVSRPMSFFDEILPQLGVAIESNQGYLPLKIKGPLRPKDITVDGSLSSQFLTGLLFAFAASVKETVTITVVDLKSKPYIDLSLDVLQKFGYKNIVNNDYCSFTISPATKNEDTIHYWVEGDWSGVAFFLVAGAIAGNIKIKGLQLDSTQADKAILQALMASEARLSIQSEQIEIIPSPLKAFHFNATECPDLFPPLVALAAYCKGKSVIEGANRLTHKESNRALTLQEEFGKMGVEIELQDDLMIVHGGKGVKGAVVHSHHDHRIAMACAVAGLKAEGETTIHDAQAIDKSYPDFYKHLRALGAIIT